MLSSTQIKAIVAEARPIIERMLDDAELIAGFRTLVAEQGGDWSALKALLKAQIQDERDESGGGKRVQKIVEKAEFASAYADMLGLGNMNEQKYIVPSFAAFTSDGGEYHYDAETGEVTDNSFLGPHSQEVDDGQPQPSSNDEHGVISFSVLVQGKDNEYVETTISLQDVELFQSGSWRARKDRNTYYVLSTRGLNDPRFHRIILGAERGDIVDHIDGNGLNNTRSNLRFATIAQNAANSVKRRGTSQYKGVIRSGPTWNAQITIDRKTRFLGKFKNEVDAAKAYDVAATEAFGEFSNINFPQSVTHSNTTLATSPEASRKAGEGVLLPLSPAANPDDDVPDFLKRGAA